MPVSALSERVRVRTADFLRFGHRLATQADEPVDPYGIAREFDLPTSTVAGWLRQMRFHRALAESPSGERVDRPRLYSFFTAHRVARLDPIAEIPTDMDTPALARHLDDHGIPHALAMISAANRWAFYEDHRDTQLYVGRRDVPRIRRLVIPGRNRLQLFAERLDDLPTATRGARVTDPFLTMIDCRAHPEGGAYAEFLDKNVVRRRRP